MWLASSYLERTLNVPCGLLPRIYSVATGLLSPCYRLIRTTPERTFRLTCLLLDIIFQVFIVKAIGKIPSRCVRDEGLCFNL